MNPFPRVDGSDGLQIGFTAKGDLVTFDGTNDFTLPVGTNNYVLTADSTQTAGLSWKANGGGDVSGPISSTLNAIARYTDTSGKVIKNSGVTIDNSNVRGAARLFTQCPIFHPPPKRKKKVSRARDCNFHKYMSFLCTRSCVPCFGDALLVVGVGLEVRSAIFVEFFAAAVADTFVVCSVFFLTVRTY